MGTDSYYINENNEFVIEDYNQQKPFKSSEEQAKKIEESNKMSQQLFLSQAYLKFKVDADLAMSVIYSLIMNVKNKDILPHNHMETFDFMVDHLIESIYE